MKLMKRLNPILLLCMAFLLCACSTTPSTPQPPLPPSDGIAGQTRTVEELIQQANKSASLAYSSKLKLQAAQMLMEERLPDNPNPKRSLAVFLQIKPQYLSPNDLQHYILLGLKLAIDQKKIELAQQLLGMESGQFDRTRVQQQGKYADLTAQAMTLAGQYFEAAEKRIWAANLFSDEEYWQNHELIWKNLRQVPFERLASTQAAQANDELAGWIALAKIIKQNAFNLDRQINALTQWQTDWPGHPAEQRLPGELNLLVSLPSLRPERITVVLPLSGRLKNAGKAVLQGFLAAFYSDPHRTTSQTRLAVIDTNKSGDINALIEAIQASTPELVIGPLSKPLVSQLASFPGYNIKTIALNYTLPEDLPAESSIFQFGLSFEDEFSQIAKRAWQENTRRALLFCPNNNWGRRTCNQLEQAWRTQNGIVADIQLFDPKQQHTSFIEKALKIDESKARKRELQYILGEKLEFEPRRRQDIDAIFLIANPVNGRQIKPLLSFYFAGSLPVYATSSIHSGKTDLTKNRDLNNIMFTEIPWVLTQANPMREMLERAWPKLADKYTRLFALGTDAYLLSSRLPLLERLSDINIPGNSGLLSLGADQQIHRQLEWAKFEAGIVKPITNEQEQN